MIALKIAIVAGVVLASAGHASAVTQPAKRSAPQQAQCREEPPAQFGPRAPLRPSARMCPAAAERREVCGHYELYWPHWLAERALPPVRHWVSKPC